MKIRNLVLIVCLTFPGAAWAGKGVKSTLPNTVNIPAVVVVPPIIDVAPPLVETAPSESGAGSESSGAKVSSFAVRLAAQITSITRELAANAPVSSESNTGAATSSAETNNETSGTQENNAQAANNDQAANAEAAVAEALGELISANASSAPVAQRAALLEKTVELLTAQIPEGALSPQESAKLSNLKRRMARLKNQG